MNYDLWNLPPDVKKDISDLFSDAAKKDRHPVNKTFLQAGDAIFTLSLPAKWAAKVGRNHFTYRLSKKDADDKWPETWFAKLLTGSDNLSDYSYLGVFDPKSGAIRITQKSKRTKDSWEVRILEHFLQRVFANDLQAVVDAGWEAYHEGRCGRCGRVLTVPESITSGIGPECAARLGLDVPHRERPSRAVDYSDAQEI